MNKHNLSGKPYRPSNGCEGDYFMDQYCFQCIHENSDPDSDRKCDILTATMCCNIDEPEYPKEWIYNEEGKPTCTKWQKWDWGNDDDPDDPDNPKAPEPYNPNQLVLPFIVEEIKQNTVKEEIMA